MTRKSWSPELLRKAAKLLVDAADNLYTAYPYTPTNPCIRTVPAVTAMIDSAQECMIAAQPDKHPSDIRARLTHAAHTKAPLSSEDVISVHHLMCKMEEEARHRNVMPAGDISQSQRIGALVTALAPFASIAQFVSEELPPDWEIIAEFPKGQKFRMVAGWFRRAKEAINFEYKKERERG